MCNISTADSEELQVSTMNSITLEELKSILFKPTKRYLIITLLLDEDEQSRWRLTDEFGNERESIRNLEVYELIEKFYKECSNNSTIQDRVKKGLEVFDESEGLYLKEYKRWLNEFALLPDGLTLPKSNLQRSCKKIKIFLTLWQEKQPWITQHDWLSLLSGDQVLEAEETQVNSARIRRRVRQANQGKLIDWTSPAALPRKILNPCLYGLTWLSHTLSIQYVTTHFTPRLSQLTSNHYLFMGRPVPTSTDKTKDTTGGLIKLFGDLAKNPIWVFNHNFWQQDLSAMSPSQLIEYIRDHLILRAIQEDDYLTRKSDREKSFQMLSADGKEQSAYQVISDQHQHTKAQAGRSAEKSEILNEEKLIEQYESRRSYFESFSKTLSKDIDRQEGMYDWMILIDRIKFANSYANITPFSESFFSKLWRLIDILLPWSQDHKVFTAPGVLKKLQVNRTTLWTQCQTWFMAYRGNHSSQAWVEPLQTFNPKLTASAWDRGRSRAVNEKFGDWCLENLNLETFETVFPDVARKVDTLNLMAQPEKEAQ